jgi:simple sugar transport system permease protein
VTCFVVTWQTQMVAAGIGAGMLAAAAMALALVYYAVALRAPQITVGLGLYVLGIGLSSLIFRMVFGIRTSPPQIDTLSPLAVPGLADLPVVGPVFFQQTILTYAAFALIPLVHLALFRTAWGLRLRATGENPRAVDALGIDVAGLRYGAAAVGGLLIGLGGAYLPVVLTGTFSDNMTAGRGWLALMLVIFGRWMPVTVLAGALLFAYVEAFQFKAGMVSKAVPPQFLLMLPYVFALVVLVRVYRGASAPRALAVPYDREARG